MSDEECELMLALYTGEEYETGPETDGLIVKLIGRGMVDRDERGVDLTNDGVDVAIGLFASGMWGGE